ncbi:hypothetical protein DYBT9275_05660 [Dyadobacter sp. CECT 9275]|uniref:DUF7133 domain-containing protein n=1 Tax=Dyadobacter helix TaxID=2822344 RepID=A0A916NEI9_9BACT|nr:hypothetical protein [Dyadobacter sp. CECT 9275]CAG5016898.1 hypothetical protein DYBT9275_05660 [Dyadobacter sp. CECT 9275]
MKRKTVLFWLTMALVHQHHSGYGQEKAGYTVENIELPKGLNAETGGISFMPDGRMIACFHRGEVMTYHPLTKTWKLFAQGLHDPLGLLVVSNNEVLVMQQPELTRLKDMNADGIAEIYETVTADFGISGNYHEFNYGPVKDYSGNLYIALNLASSGDGIRSRVRGDLNLLGRDGEGRKQMFSVVPYRGWVMQYTPEKRLVPYASGLRSPNGIAMDPAGNLFVADNQGDWVASSALYNVRKDHFYGHPAGLVWKKGWDKGSPFDTPITYLDSLRTAPAVWFPQGIIANSPSQPLFDITEGKFGPFKGQLFIGEMNRDRIVRVVLERVNGEFQGACIPFIDGTGLLKGNNRMAFAPDGSLWVGHTEHGWIGSKGIQKISFTGHVPTDILKMSLTKTGFDITFTKEMDEKTVTDTARYHLRHYRYKYYKKPANEPVDETIQFDRQEVPIQSITLSPDHKKVSMRIDALKEGYVYELKLEPLKSTDQEQLVNRLICYTLNHLR